MTSPQPRIDGSSTDETSLPPQRGPHRQPKVSTRVPPEVRRWYHEQAVARGTSISALIREQVLAVVPDDIPA